MVVWLVVVWMCCWWWLVCWYWSLVVVLLVWWVCWWWLCWLLLWRNVVVVVFCVGIRLLLLVGWFWVVWLVVGRIVLGWVIGDCICWCWVWILLVVGLLIWYRLVVWLSGCVGLVFVRLFILLLDLLWSVCFVWILVYCCWYFWVLLGWLVLVCLRLGIVFSLGCW